MRFKRILGGLILFLGWGLLDLSLAGGAAQSQTLEYAGLLTIAYPDVEIRRVDTDIWFSLPQGAQTVFGIGDSLRTRRWGRAHLDLGLDSASALILPQSAFTLEAFSGVGADVRLEMILIGRGVFEFPQSDYQMDYQISLGAHQINSADLTHASRLALWGGIGEQATYVVNDVGELWVNYLDEETQLEPQTGYRLQPDEATPAMVDLIMPASFAHIESRLEGCEDQTTVTPVDGGLLRVRAGPGTDYFYMGSIETGEAVTLMGQSLADSGLWYRIRFLNDFGWVLASAVTTTCTNVPQLPPNFIAIQTGVVDVQAIELTLLEPFFGAAGRDVWFYRVLNRAAGEEAGE